MAIIVDTGVDNAGLRAGLGQAESMIDSAVRRMGTRLATVGSGFGTGAEFALGRMAKLGQATTHMERMVGVSGRLNASLDKMSGLFNSALGIGATLGGFALLERAFTRSIEKAREFQTAQIAIAATLQSAYKITGTSGREVSGPEAFQFATQQAQRFNLDIIQRQARNILVYQEQLGAFQSSLAAGARKGLAPTQILNLSESAAVVAKTLGLRGEQIANAARLLMGGGVNVGRSTIGRALGVSNVDVSTRSGQELYDFLQNKMKGFMSPEIQQSFGKSIEGIMSTLESKFDIFWSKVGGKFMKNISPALEELGEALSGTDAEKFAETLSNMFMSIFKALEAIVRSPAIPYIMKFVEFLANYGDKIIIGAVLLKLVGILGSASGQVLGFASTLDKLAATALETTRAIDATTASIERNAAAAGTAGGGGMLGGVPAAARIGGKMAAGEAALATTWVLSENQQAAVRKLMQAGKVEQAQNLAQGFYSQRLRTGALGGMPQFQALSEAEKARIVMGAEGNIARQELGGFLGMAAMGTMAGGAGEAAAAGTWSQRNLPTFTSWGSKLAPWGAKALKGGMYGMLAGTGIELASSSLGLNKSPMGAGITNALSYGVGGAIMGSTIAPGIGTAIGGAAGVLVGVFKSLGDAGRKAADEFEAAAAALRETREKFPAGAKMSDLKQQERQIRQSMKTGKIANLDEQGITKATPGISWIPIPLWGIDKATTTGAIPGEIEDPRGQKALQHDLRENLKAQKELKEQGNLKFEADRKVSSAQEELQFWQSASKALDMSYGRGAMMRRPEVAAQLQLAELKQMYTGGQLRPVDTDLVKRWQDMQAGMEKLAKASEARGGKTLTGTAAEQEEAERDRLKKEQQNIMDAQYNRLRRQIQERPKDQQEAMKLELQQRAAALDLRPVAGEYIKGRLSIQQQMLGQKELLGPDYEKTLKQALANFDALFNKPLRKIENDIQNLSLGVDSENVLDAARLAFRAVREKIRQAVHVFHSMSKAMGEKLLAQREEQFQAIQMKEAYVAPRRLGQIPTAQSEIAQMEASRLSTMAGAMRTPQTMGAYNLIAQLEGERRSQRWTPEQFQQFQTQSIQQAKQDIFRNWQAQTLAAQQFRLEEQARPIQEQMAHMALPQARLNVEQAQYQTEMYNASLNPRNARMMERAARIVGRGEERLSLGEAESLVRKGIDLQRKSLAMAEKKAQMDEQLAEIADKNIDVLSKQNDLAAAIKWEDLAKVVDDSTAALQALTDYAKGIVGDVTTPDAKKKGKPATSTTEPGKEGGKGSELPPINIAISGGATITEKDIDQWMPKIREKLCRLAAQSGGRG
jgi:hypothetical protein